MGEKENQENGTNLSENGKDDTEGSENGKAETEFSENGKEDTEGSETGKDDTEGSENGKDDTEGSENGRETPDKSETENGHKLEPEKEKSPSAKRPLECDEVENGTQEKEAKRAREENGPDDDQSSPHKTTNHVLLAC